MVRSGDLELHCAYAGSESADAPLVVLLHGFPAGWSTWRHQLTGLAEAGFLAVAPDLRGAGQSDKPPEVAAYRSDCFIGDVEAVARAFGRDSLALVGHDVGGGLAWATAMRKPALVSRLAILNSVHPVGFSRQMRHLSQVRRSWYIFLFQVPVLPEIIAGRRDLGLLRAALLGDGLSAEATEDLLSAVKAPAALHATINWYRASVREAILWSSEPAKVSAPSLIVWGDRERYLDPALADPPSDWVTNTRVVHLPEAGHWVMLDSPEKVTELLVDHLTRG